MNIYINLHIKATKTSATENWHGKRYHQSYDILVADFKKNTIFRIHAHVHTHTHNTNNVNGTCTIFRTYTHVHTRTHIYK